jgi:hypothetical protein
MGFHPALAAKLLVAAALLNTAPADAVQDGAQGALTQPDTNAAAMVSTAPQGASEGTNSGAHLLLTSFRPQPMQPHRQPVRRRCLMPHPNLSHEAAKLGLGGYTRVSYQGAKTYTPRCIRMLYFSACKGATRHRVIVRFIQGRRSVVAMRTGLCVTGRPRA